MERPGVDPIENLLRCTHPHAGEHCFECGAWRTDDGIWRQPTRIAALRDIPVDAAVPVTQTEKRLRARMLFCLAYLGCDPVEAVETLDALMSAPDELVMTAMRCMASLMPSVEELAASLGAPPPSTQGPS